MSPPAILVRDLSKTYSPGLQGGYRTFRQALVSAAAAPWRRSSGRASPQQPRWALSDVSFEVPRGQILGIIGPNGAGKSTLLKVLSRVTPPTAGRVETRGRVGGLLEIGTGFHPELTGRENVFLNGVILGLSVTEVRERLDAIVDFSGLEDRLDEPVKHYSSGMQMRLAFAVAAELRPEILLLDEVLAVGDAEFQQKCIGRMEGVTREGRTVLLVSHGLGAVQSLCQRVLLLDAGRIAADGPPGEVIASYLGACQDGPSSQVIMDADIVRGSGKIRPVRVRLANAIADRFCTYWRQALDLELELDVLEPVRDVSLGAGIRLPDSTWVFCLHHDDGGASRWTFERGRYICRFRIQHDLQPGSYRLALGAHAQHYSNTLYHTEPVIVRVLDASLEGEQPRIYNPGIVGARGEWQAPVRTGEDALFHA